MLSKTPGWNHSAGEGAKLLVLFATGCGREAGAVVPLLGGHAAGVGGCHGVLWLVSRLDSTMPAPSEGTP